MIGWYHAVCAAALPWLWWLRPAWTGVALAMLLLVHRRALQHRAGEPWRAGVVVVSAAVALAVTGGWVVLIAWLVPAVLIGLSAWAEFGGATAGGRPDSIDCVTAAVAAAVFAVRPDLLQTDHGGWVAPVVLLLAARRFGVGVVGVRAPDSDIDVSGPPSRETRGTLSLSGTVAGDHALPSTVGLEVTVKAGHSLAVLFDGRSNGRHLFESLAGRRPLAEGQLSIDGQPLETGDRLIAAVSVWEPLVRGGIEENLAALLDAPLSVDQLVGLRESFALDDVGVALGGGTIGRNGEPLDAHDRMMLQLARVAVSSFRVLIVMDPMLWFDPVRAEIRRSAIVRASVGRTAVWLTPDRDLARRADRTVLFSHGTLRDIRIEDLLVEV